MAGSEKWKRLAEAFAGKTVHGAVRGMGTEGMAEYPQVELKEMADTLAGLSDRQWGRYAFSREPLEGKFDNAQKDDYTEKANQCGREWAERTAEEFGERHPRKLAEKMGMRIFTPKTPVGGGNVLFAQYVRPDEITVFTDCIDRASRLREESGCGLLQKDRLMEVLLAHELFHAVEEQNQERIYTRTEKVELWRKPFSNRSTIVCLSEIAAMAFAKELLGLEYSPYVLDVLLVYAYNKDMAWGLYDEICALAEI